MSEDKSLHRITVNLTSRGQFALEQINSVTGEGITDAINGALRLYALLVTAPPGSALYMREPGAAYERIHLP